jgi:type III pantothenate kinase
LVRRSILGYINACPITPVASQLPTALQQRLSIADSESRIQSIKKNMDLLIDIGNSRLKWATHDQSGVDRKWYFAEPIVHAGDYHACIATLWGDLPQPERVALCSVAASEAACSVIDRVESLWGLGVQQLANADSTYDIISNYAFGELGVDRWLAVIGARNLLEGDLLIADFGSAVNIEFLASDNRYLGGMILPGRSLMHHSLVGGTAMEVTELAPFNGQLGESTQAAISSGVLSALTGALDKAMQFAEKQHKREWRVIITGGDASMLAPYLSDEYILEPNLVFIGMSEVVNWQG